MGDPATLSRQQQDDVITAAITRSYGTVQIAGQIAGQKTGEKQ
jgi:hypothetical protein